MEFRLPFTQAVSSPEKKKKKIAHVPKDITRSFVPHGEELEPRLMPDATISPIPPDLLSASQKEHDDVTVVQERVDMLVQEMEVKTAELGLDITDIATAEAGTATASQNLAVAIAGREELQGTLRTLQASLDQLTVERGGHTQVIEQLQNDIRTLNTTLETQKQQLQESQRKAATLIPHPQNTLAILSQQKTVREEQRGNLQNEDRAIAADPSLTPSVKNALLKQKTNQIIVVSKQIVVLTTKIAQEQARLDQAVAWAQRDVDRLTAVLAQVQKLQAAAPALATRTAAAYVQTITVNLKLAQVALQAARDRRAASQQLPDTITSQQAAVSATVTSLEGKTGLLQKEEKIIKTIDTIMESTSTEIIAATASLALATDLQSRRQETRDAMSQALDAAIAEENADATSLTTISDSLLFAQEQLVMEMEETEAADQTIRDFEAAEEERVREELLAKAVEEALRVKAEEEARLRDSDREVLPRGPTAHQTIITTAGAQASININAFNADGMIGSPSFTILTQPAHGTLQSFTGDPLAGSSLKYTSAPDFTGTDRFVYQIAEPGDGTSRRAMMHDISKRMDIGRENESLLTVEVSITVTAAVEAPVQPPEAITNPLTIITVPTIQAEDVQPKLLFALHALEQATPALKSKADQGLLTVQDILGLDAQALSPTHALAISVLQAQQVQLHDDILDHKTSRETLLAAGGDNAVGIAALDAVIQDLTNREQVAAGQAALLRYATVLLSTTDPLSPQLQQLRDDLRDFLTAIENHSPIPRRSLVDATALQSPRTGTVAQSGVTSNAGPVGLHSWQGSMATPAVIGGGESIVLHGAVSAVDLGGAGNFTMGLSGTVHLSIPGATATLYGYRGEKQCAAIPVRDGETFTLSDPLGITSMVVVSASKADTTLTNLSVINRTDLAPMQATPVGIATNQQVAIGSAIPVSSYDGGAAWWRKSVGNQGNGINSEFGYYVPLDPTKYNLEWIEGGDGNSRFTGPPVYLTSWKAGYYGSYPAGNEIESNRYTFLSKNMLLIYPGTPGVLWVPISSFSGFRLSGREGNALQDVMPPEGPDALNVGLVNRRAQGGSGWGDHHELHSGQMEQAVGSFQGSFTVRNDSAGTMTIDQVIVHSGQTSSLQDPVVNNLGGTSIRSGNIQDLSIGVPEGQTVNDKRPYWTIGFVIGGKEYAMANGNYRYPHQSDPVTMQTTEGRLPPDIARNLQRIAAKAPGGVTNVGIGNLTYRVTDQGVVTLAPSGSGEPVKLSALPADVRYDFLNQFLGTKERAALLEFLIGNYLQHQYDLSMATQMAETKLDIALHNPQLLLANINLSPLDSATPDVDSVLKAVAQALVPAASAKVVATPLSHTGATASLVTDTGVQWDGMEIRPLLTSLSPLNLKNLKTYNNNGVPLGVQLHENETTEVRFSLDAPAFLNASMPKLPAGMSWTLFKDGKPLHQSIRDQHSAMTMSTILPKGDFRLAMTAGESRTIENVRVPPDTTQNFSLSLTLSTPSSSKIEGVISREGSGKVMPVSMSVAEFDEDSGKRKEFKNVSVLDSSKPVWVVIHGRTDTPDSNNMKELTKKLVALAGNAFQVVSIDWNEAANDVARIFGKDVGDLDDAEWTPAVGAWVGQQLLAQGFKPAQINFKSHSHGTFVGFFAAEWIKNNTDNHEKVASIIALDSAKNPIFFGANIPEEHIVFSEVSTHSIAFHSSIFGSKNRAFGAERAITITSSSIDPFKEHGFAVTMYADILDDIKNGKNPAIVSHFSLTAEGNISVAGLPNVDGYDAWIEVRTAKETTPDGDWWKAQATTLRLPNADGSWKDAIIDPDAPTSLPSIPKTGPGTYLP